MAYKQIAELEEQEAHIWIDYHEQKVCVETNRATVMNRMARKGYKPQEEYKMDGEVYGCYYEFPITMVTKFASAIFKFSGTVSNEEDSDD